jgi:hypothetical protein
MKCHDVEGKQDGQKKRDAPENLPCLPKAIHMAEKVGEKLGNGKIL